ncbi:YcaO-like family protein [Lysinibacillus fusiformis]|uniref:YcaO-like family protein n=1 Tax=Lysinibacillus fusiformis TaxID=28031 RepID=UPI00263A539C|nr:YcaO-like family protein [Lysinibacillus fusiformis]MDC6268626.1 YcaO-like family protein [Lysinibacillus sphaericus]MDN4969419.1 YcaO-like family protein [Lysinibacillus fusiformis]
MKLNESPFLLRSFSVKGKLYLDSYVYAQMYTNTDASKGFGLRYNKISAIKAGLGEHIERLCAVSNFRKQEVINSYPVIDCFNLLTGDIAKVQADIIFLNFDLPMFKNIDATNYFTDSCGLASHITSMEAIEGGLNEFIERQSLVTNWLTKSPGEKISYSLLKEKNSTNIKLLNMIKLAENMSDVIFSYNISLIEGIYVILTVGTKGIAFSSGVGTDSLLEKAIEKSLNEYLMIIESCLIKDQIDEKFLDIYAANFYSLTVEEFLESYKYLLEGGDLLTELSYSSQKNKMENWILNLKEKYGLNIFACFLPHPMKHINSKVVKVFSPEGFPHINTELFDPEEYEISKYLIGKEFYNKYKSIPFA